MLKSNKNEIRGIRKIAAKERYEMMSDEFSHPCCGVCGFAYPPIMQGHHVKPVASSATKSTETIWLCPNCHAMVHEIIRCHFSNKRPTHYRTRILHLDYWLSDICDKAVRDKLLELARKSQIA